MGGRGNLNVRLGSVFLILLQPRRTRPGVFQARGFAGTSSAQDGVDRAGRRSSHHHRHHRHHRRDAGTARAPDTACSAAGRGTRPGSGAHSSKARPAQRHVILLPRGHWPMANGHWQQSATAPWQTPLTTAAASRGTPTPRSLARLLARARLSRYVMDTVASSTARHRVPSAAVATGVGYVRFEFRGRNSW